MRGQAITDTDIMNGRLAMGDELYSSSGSPEALPAQGQQVGVGQRAAGKMIGSSMRTRPRQDACMDAGYGRLEGCPTSTVHVRQPPGAGSLFLPAFGTPAKGGNRALRG